MEEEHIGEESGEEIGEEEITERLAEDSGSKAGWPVSQKRAPKMQVEQLQGLLAKTLWKRGWLEKTDSW